jgi:lipid II:glycine glycyltransferase (peptidoglycan interpeptide bridge formation enzyme)
MNKCGNITWRINPYDELISKTVFTMAVQDETHAIKLQDCFETICKQYSRGQKSAMHKAERLGVSVKLGSTMEDWQAYYDTYEDSLRRWGEKASSSYTFDLFREMFRRDSDCVKLFLATYDEKIIAGALCFYSKWHAVYWHGAALEYYFKLRPVNMLMSEAIKTACEEGYTWFDFNPSGGHQGVKAFKESFGAQALPCPVVRTESVRSRVIGKSSRIIEKIREIASLLLNR